MYGLEQLDREIQALRELLSQPSAASRRINESPDSSGLPLLIGHIPWNAVYVLSASNLKCSETRYSS